MTDLELEELKASLAELPPKLGKHARAYFHPDIIRSLIARVEEAEGRLARAASFTINETTAIERRIGRRGEVSWAVKEGGFVLNADGEWEYEPLPSSRDDEFIARTRFSLDDAFQRCGATLPPPSPSES